MVSSGFVNPRQSADFAPLDRLSHFPRLVSIRVTRSEVRALLCHTARHRRAASQFRALRSLDLSHNSLTRLDTALAALARLHTLNLAHNNLTQVEYQPEQDCCRL